MGENNSFTFWSNMKEAIDIYEGDPVFQYKMYDALVEYALYEVKPEDDGTKDAKILMSFVQSMVPSLDKSRNFNQKCAEAGSVGGRKEKFSVEQIENAIKEAAKSLNKVPSRAEVAMKYEELYGEKISVKTVSRKCKDDKKKEIAEGTLGQNRDTTDVSEDKINVPGTKQGQENVPEGQNKCPFVF